MDRQSAVHAIYAESLVFESNFGLAGGPAADSGSEFTRRAQSIPAEGAATCSSGKTVGALEALISHHLWPGF